jgi:lipopolysaccharide/colanic/teichoic acid biosynthesis glycosyltransferase
VAKYEDWQRKRMEVPQGLTGLWQVSGRSDLPFDEMALLDLWYIDNWSLGLDLKIMLRTVPAVLLGSGAY